MNKLLSLALAVSLVGPLMSMSGSRAERGKPVRIRGTVESIDAASLAVKSREGSTVKASLTDKTRFTAMEKASVKDITTESYIGVTAMPQADGSQKAIAIHIFLPKQRGTGEGHGPWDLQPGSTMTNAAVASTVAGNDGQVITVRYKQGEKQGEQRIITTPQTIVVRYASGDRNEIKPGMRVILINARQGADGMFNVPNVGYGRGGATPPM